MKAIVSNRFWVPLTDLTADRAERMYQFRHYDEAKCNKCEMLPERHSEICDECPAYRGEVAMWKTVEKSGKDYIGVPRGNRKKLQLFAGDLVKSKEDRRGATPMRTKIKFTGKLRKHQLKPVADAIKKGYGVMLAPPRSGKTVMGACVSCRLGLKTLILAGQQEWLDEFYRTFVGDDDHPPMSNIPELREQTGRPIIKNGCKTVEDFKRHDICLSTYQSFIHAGGRKVLKKIASMFGTIVVDEVHDGAATKYAQTLLTFNAKHVFGLTGTDDRKDGLYCQPADTMVSTPTGDKPIQDFVIGDPVWSYNHNTQTVEASTVTATIKRPPEPIYEVVHEHGTLRCTGDHQLWSTTRNQYVRVRDLQDIDVLLTLHDPGLEVIA